MKKFLIILCTGILCLVQPFSHAQVSEIDWGPVMKAKKRIAPTNFVGASEYEVYSLCYVPRFFYAVIGFFPMSPAYYIKAYDKTSMEETGQFDLLTPKLFKGKVNDKKWFFGDIYFVDLIYRDNNFYLFYSGLDKKEKKHRLYCRTLDNTGTQQGEDIELADFSYKGTSEDGKYMIMYPSDTSGFMVFEAQPKKKKTFTFKASYYDWDIAKQYEQEFDIETEGESASILDIEVDNNAIAYMYVKSYGKKKKKEVPVTYSLLTLDLVEGGGLQTFEVTLDDEKKLGNATLILDPTDTTCKMLGYYYGEKISKGAEGTFYMKVSGLTGEEISSAQEEFPSNSSGFSPTSDDGRGGSTDENPDADVLIRNILQDEAGNTYMIGEDWYQVTYCNSKRCYTVTYYANIHITKFNPAGGIEWHSIIPKNQTAFGYYSGFSSFITEDAVVLIYNDNPDNLKKTKGKAAYVNYKKSHVVGAKINLDDGAVTKSELYNPVTDDAFKKNRVAVLGAQQINGSEIMMISTKGFRKYRLGTLKIDSFRW